MDRSPRFARLALAVALALSLSLGGAPAAQARPPRSPAAHVSRHLEQIGVDADTRAAIAAIVAESEAAGAGLEAEIRAARERMRALLSAPETDRAAVMAQADALDALHARAHRNRLETLLRIHDRLTPEQRAALVALREKERPWRRGRGPLGRCSGDLRAQCADAPDGAAALRCLAERWDALSEPCRDAVTHGRGGAPDDGPPPPPLAPD